MKVSVGDCLVGNLLSLEDDTRRIGLVVEDFNEHGLCVVEWMNVHEESAWRREYLDEGIAKLYKRRAESMK